MPDQENTIDVKKLEQFAIKCKTQILVGFLSGREHVPTLHKDKSGEYRGYDGGKPNLKSEDTAELAKRLSYGDGHIPPRPFLEEGMAEKKETLLAEFKIQAEKVHAGQKPNWDKVGTMAVGAIQEFVRGDYYRSHVPNSQKTIDYKGSDKPLIDGGDLIGALTFVVDGK
jgi:hypothetical protein